MYKYLDSVLKRLTREIYRVFQSFRTLPFDELNVVPSVRTMYEELADLNYQAFVQIAKHYYALKGEAVTTDISLLVSEHLIKPSAVMKYSYDSELIRKRDRLLEALIATGGDVTEIDKAMQYWSQTTGQFALEVADAALKQSRIDRGVKLVRWCCADDERTCTNCHKLDGRIFHADAVPDKPHPRCRCWTEEV